MDIQFLLDADNFWPALEADIAAARDSVHIQTLSFEADAAGRKLTAAMAACTAGDRRIIVDEFYARHRVNDRYLRHPRNWFRRASWRERDDTLRMYDELARLGTQVKLVNPVGFLHLHCHLRNHKKIITIDDSISYVGGTNFSEHNFAWHDLMVRFDDRAVTGYLREDFMTTWAGSDAGGSEQLGELTIHRLDGVSNEAAFAPVIQLMESARHNVTVVSPYLTFPFIDALARAQASGAEVMLLTPEHNNWEGMRDYVSWHGDRAGIDVLLYPRMSHMKAMVIDDRYLLLGSSNFDFLSYHYLQEILLVFDSPTMVRRFRDEILDADLAAARPAPPVSDTRGRYLSLQVGAAARLCHLYRGASRRVLE